MQMIQEEYNESKFRYIHSSTERKSGYKFQLAIQLGETYDNYRLPMNIYEGDI